MDITKHVVDGVFIVELKGDLDSRSAPTVQEQLLRSLPENGRIILDLNGVSFVSSAGLRTILLLYRQAQAANSLVALVGCSEEIRRVLSATGFLGFFVVVDEFADALVVLRRPEPQESGAV